MQAVCLHHPDGACGYRFDYKGQSICIMTDHEAGETAIDERICEVIAGSDIVIIDGMYTDGEYPPLKGYGHSSWQAALDICMRANVKVPVLFHHHPNRLDEQLDEIKLQAQKIHPKCLIAFDGMELSP